MMARTRRELAIAHRAQHPAERLFADRNAELGIDPLRQIDETPAHHPVHCRIGADLDDPPERLALRGVEQRSVAWRLAVEKPRGPVCVEGHHPLAHRLPRDTADRRRRVARGAFIDRRQRQQAPGLVGIPRGFR